MRKVTTKRESDYLFWLWNEQALRMLQKPPQDERGVRLILQQVIQDSIRMYYVAPDSEQS